MAISWPNINTIVMVTPNDGLNGFIGQGGGDLKTHLDQMTGLAFTLTGSDIGGQAIRLQVNPNNSRLINIDNDEAFAIYESNGVRIVGKTPIAVRHGCQDLLEILGVRWFARNSAWTVIPGSLNGPVTIDKVDYPHYKWRSILPVNPTQAIDNQALLQWRKRMRGMGNGTYLVGHSYGAIVTHAGYTMNPYTAPPTWICPAGWQPGSGQWQLNTTNQEVMAAALSYAQSLSTGANVANATLYPDILQRRTVSIDPNDGPGFCISGNQAISDAVYNLANHVANNDSNPDRFITLHSYNVYDQIPAAALNPKITPVITHRVVGTDVPGRYRTHWRIDGFKAKSVTNIGYYDYAGIPGWDFTQPKWSIRENGLREQVENALNAASLGATLYYSECGDGIGMYGILNYALYKAMWNPYLDVDALLEDFYSRAFGPAAGSARRWYGWLLSEPRLTRASMKHAATILQQAQNQAAGNAAIITRIRHLQWYTRWLYLITIAAPYSTNLHSTWSTATTDQIMELYSFGCRIRNANVLHHFPDTQNFVRPQLVSRGLTPSQIGALENFTLPTSTESDNWLALMLDDLETDDDYADYVEVRGKQLTPHGTASESTLARSINWQQVLLVKAQAGTVTLHVRCRDGFQWMDENGKELFYERFSSSQQDRVVQVPAPYSGIYRLRFYGGIIENGQSTIEGAAYLAGPNNGYRRSGEWWQGQVNGYMYVPPGTQRFVIGAGRHGGFAIPQISLWDPDGVQVLNAASANSAEKDPKEWVIEVPSGKDGRLWRMRGEFGGVGGDMWLLGIPPLFYHNPEQLLILEEDTGGVGSEPNITNHSSINHTVGGPYQIQLDFTPVNGRQLVACVMHRGDVASNPGGWTQHVAFGTANNRMSVWTKIANNEGVNPTYNFGGTQNQKYSIIAMEVNPPGNFDKFATTTIPGSSNTISTGTTPTLSTSSQLSIVFVGGIGPFGGSAPRVAWTNGYTPLVEHAGGDFSHVSAAVAYKTGVGPGAQESTASWTTNLAASYATVVTFSPTFITHEASGGVTEPLPILQGQAETFPAPPFPGAAWHTPWTFYPGPQDPPITIETFLNRHRDNMTILSQHKHTGEDGEGAQGLGTEATGLQYIKFRNQTSVPPAPGPGKIILFVQNNRLYIRRGNGPPEEIAKSN